MKKEFVSIYPPEVLWLLEECMYAYIGTSDLERKPHITPVIFVFDGKNLYVVTSKISKKVKNIRQNNQVSLLIDFRDPIDIMNNQAVLIKGKGKILRIHDVIFKLPTLIKIRQLFYKKYPNYIKKYAQEQEKLPLAWRTTLFVSRLLIRIQVEEFAYWRRASRVHIPL